MSVKWATQKIQDWTAAVFFDIKPVAKYNSDSTYFDQPLTDISSDAFTIVEPVSQDLCVERWVYGDTMIACVKIEGSLTRNFVPTDP